MFPADPLYSTRSPWPAPEIENQTYLIQVDDWLPEVVALLVEVSHTDLSEVTWMVLVHVGSVVMLTTSKTTTTWMLAVLSYTTVTGGNVSAAIKRKLSAISYSNLSIPRALKIFAEQSSSQVENPFNSTIAVAEIPLTEELILRDNVLLAGLAQVGRHLDVVCRAVVVTWKLELLIFPNAGGFLMCAR